MKYFLTFAIAVIVCFTISGNLLASLLVGLFGGLILYVFFPTSSATSDEDINHDATLEYLKNQDDDLEDDEEVSDANPEPTTIIEKFWPEGTTTPSFYLSNDVADLSLSKDWKRETLVRIPPVQETAKYVLLGAMQQHNDKNLFVEFNQKIGDYYLYRLITNYPSNSKDQDATN